MKRTDAFVYTAVRAIPEQLQPGVLYHSAAFEIASHLCACGCGFEVVTGLRPDRWTLKVIDGRPSLSPSIGNGSFPCKSHYFIVSGHVRWAGVYTDKMIALARKHDNPRAHAPMPFWRRALRIIQRIFASNRNQR